jgi:uncharacterized protein YeaO (DUF488 family)
MPEIALKRIYEPASAADGYRVLVDRLWARGMSKGEAALDAWLKQVAPSTELRTWFSHQEERWSGFQERYTRELDSPRVVDLLGCLVRQARRHPVTLLFGARDEVHNEAVVLRDHLRTVKSAAPHDAGTLALDALAAVAWARPTHAAATGDIVAFLAGGLDAAALDAALDWLCQHKLIVCRHEAWELAPRGERLAIAAQRTPGDLPAPPGSRGLAPRVESRA